MEVKWKQKPIFWLSLLVRWGFWGKGVTNPRWPGQMTLPYPDTILQSLRTRLSLELITWTIPLPYGNLWERGTLDTFPTDKLVREISRIVSGSFISCLAEHRKILACRARQLLWDLQVKAFKVSHCHVILLLWLVWTPAQNQRLLEKSGFPCHKDFVFNFWLTGVF